MPTASDPRPWVERHSGLSVLVLLIGCVLLAVGLAAASALPGGRFAAIGLFAVVLIGSRPYLRWRLGRSIADARADPNVLWAGVARFDRLEALRAGVDPLPVAPYGTRATQVLLTRVGISLRPRSPRWEWTGSDIPYSSVAAASVGKATVGRTRLPTLTLLIGNTEVHLPIVTSAKGLAELVNGSAIAPRMVHASERHPSLAGHDETDDRPPVPTDATVLSQSWTGRHRWLVFGTYNVFFLGGLGLSIGGFRSHVVTLGVLGLVLVYGTLLGLAISRIRAQRELRRQREQLTAQLESEGPAR